MPLFYKAVQANRENKEGVKTWHPSLVKMKKVVNTQTLAEDIAEKSSLTAGDVQSTVRNLLSVMRRYLLESYTVRLEGLGTFTMKVRSTGKGVDTKEEVSIAQITSMLCRFTPEYSRPVGVGTTRTITKGLLFVPANLIEKSVVGGDGNDSENGGKEPLSE